MDGRETARPVPVDGGDIPAWTRGEGASALLFLHGWSLDHRIWQPQVEDEALAARHRLIAIDRRGFGAASAPPDLGREAADLVALLDQFAIDRAIVVGQSQAGRVALQFATDHADRLSGLVLVGAPVGGFEPVPRPEEDVPVDRYRALVRDGRIDEMKRLWSRHPMIADGGGSDAPIVAMLRDYDGRDLLAASPPAGPDIRQLGRIEVPALVVTGGRDTAWRRLVGDAIAYALPRGERADIPDAGHLCNADAPATFNRLLGDFARSIDG
jgi:pimeloyl-ACP methyl ester carboxylesterase